MCIQLIERYAVCKCVYHVHAVDQCSSYGQHPVQQKTILVGYTCPNHTTQRFSYSKPSSNMASGRDHDYSSGSSRSSRTR